MSLMVAIWGPEHDLTDAWLRRVESTVPAGTALVHAGVRRTESRVPHVRTRSDDPLSALKALTQREPEKDILLLRTGAELQTDSWQRLQKALLSVTDAQSMSALNPFDTGFNPFTCITDSSTDSRRMDQLVFCYAEHLVAAVDQAATCCSLWRRPDDETSAALLAAADWQDFSRKLAVRGKLAYLCDDIYVHHKSASNARPVQQQPALNRLRSRLRLIATDMLAEGLPPIPLPGLDKKPVQLHVSHSWGGGTQEWINNIAAIQTDRYHLQLRSVSESDNLNTAQKFELALVNQPDMPALGSWLLTQPITSTADSSREYRLIIEDVMTRYHVEQIVISSLIGHSTEILDQQCPTLVVFHDYFPYWPRLDIAIDELSSEQTARRLVDESDQNQQELHHRKLSNRTAEQWIKLRHSLISKLKRPNTVLVAPDQSVINNLVKIDSSLDSAEIHVIPHGATPLKRQKPQGLQADPGQRKLRILIPGRLSDVKGKHLLTPLVESCADIADFWLLGSGKDAEEFFGMSSVHIIMDYERERLPELISVVQPDLALLMSVVSETFSYTLSEMRQLGVPVIATTVGSFRNRIEDGKSGFLCRPDAATIAEKIRQLHESPELLGSITSSAFAADKQTLQSMTERYNAIFPSDIKVPLRYSVRHYTLTDAQLSELSADRDWFESRTSSLSSKVDEQQSELHRRAQWAHDLNTQLEDKLAWATSLQDELLYTKDQFGKLETLRIELQKAYEKLDLDNQEKQAGLEHRQREIEELTERYMSVVNSRSWKLTKPLRYLSRLSHRIAARSAYWIRRGPMLMGRTVSSMKTRGLKGTLSRISSELRPQERFRTGKANIVTSDPLEILEFESVEQPRVSVVIPVYNQFAHTHQCLSSILQAANDCSFEVIVVDDASSDDTELMLAQFKGINYIRNPENRGFVITCNRGAAEAQGDYVFFLNNDTAVADHWLDTLLEVFEKRPDAGLVGSKLIYPDGRLQEAGGIIFNDASGWNYGKFEDPDDPRFNYLREVDYCSGAAIMIRRDTFEAIGGFDTRFAPAYYEDVDLAFEVRSHGLKPYYQPSSVVTHYEGITSGTDTASGTKRYQLINQTKFHEKWHQTLISNPRSGIDIELARSHRSQREVLVIDATTPDISQDAGSIRMVNLFSILNDLNCRITFFADNRAWVEGASDRLQQMGVEVWYAPYLKSPEEFLETHGRRFETIIVSRYYIAENYIRLIEKYAPHAKLVFDTVDLHFLRELRQAELKQDEQIHAQAELTRQKELAVASKADLTLVVSPFEKDYLAQIDPNLSVEIVATIVDVVGNRTSWAERADIMFVGGYQHPPNVDAVMYFVNEVFPLIRRKLPDVKFHIIGSKAPPEVTKLAQDGVIYHGYVEDLEPFLDGIRVAVAPLRFGAGVKGKINTSMSYGQPVVATSVGVEGMYSEDGLNVLVGDTPEAFAEAVCRLYSNEVLWNRLSEHGLENVEKYFSFNAARESAERMINFKKAAFQDPR